MPNRLKDLKITSTDLVTAGANPDAHIRLFKRKDEDESETLLQKAIAAFLGVFGKGKADDNIAVEKDAKTFDQKIEQELMREVTSQAWGFTYALNESLCSIICDGELSEDEKGEMLITSLNEFTETMRGAIPQWAAGEKAKDSESVEKSAGQETAFDALIAKYLKTPDTKKSTKPQIKEEADTMKIDKSKMTPEELAALEALEKKYGTADEPEATPAAPDIGDGVAKGATTLAGNVATPAPELHPEVKKALEANAAMASQIEALQKSLEIKDLTAVAKKYEIVGKKADELAPKLYDLKKAGGTAYDDFIGLLDEQVTMVEKGGLFGEVGLNTSGSIEADNALDAKAAEIRKANPTMTQAEAFAKAYEENPELAASYEKIYKGRA